MRLAAIDSGLFKLDGGAMYGVVPKALWSKFNPADELNRCVWSMRCLLVETGDRLVLIDCGIGDKQGEKFYKIFGFHGEDTLISSLAKEGVTPEDITDVILTHLHFDHCGGAIRRDGDKLRTTFPNATYWSHEDHWNWATDPNPREKASFLAENFAPIQAADQLKFAKDREEIIPGISVRTFFGHTEAMMVPIIQHKDRKLVYLADLQPSVSHFPLPYVMGYDIRPMQTMAERKDFLAEALREDYLFCFEHDPVNEACSLKQGRKWVEADQIFKISEL